MLQANLCEKNLNDLRIQMSIILFLSFNNFLIFVGYYRLNILSQGF